jgi:hypothetical protein
MRKEWDIGESGCSGPIRRGWTLRVYWAAISGMNWLAMTLPMPVAWS